jgi:LuxR family maltose regulon positive regulatory protein
LNEGIELGRPMTLVSAPAGFGKTTCISEWLAGWKLPVAWLSLDEEDNNPGRFFLSLAAALRKIENSSGEGFTQLHEVERVLNSGQLSPADVILSALVADILEYPGRFILVLDDFHLIQDPFILKVFERLVASLFQVHRPQPLHLVLLSREDPALPVARLRANNQLTEIRASELRFSRAEAAQFLNSALGLSLENHNIRTLADRTEGWITGLQLAGLSIRGRADPSRFIHELSGSHRFILSYLIEEVLSRQAEDVQQFLLETSILDQLSGDLCRAVTGRADSPALLEQLWGDNLFLVPLDEEAANGAGATWYRYHHLFSDLLRNRQAQLQGEKTAELHRRASRWFALACAASPFDSRAELASAAIRHALASRSLHRLLSVHDHAQVDNCQHGQNGDWGGDGCFQHLNPAMVSQKAHRTPFRVLPVLAGYRQYPNK